MSGAIGIGGELGLVREFLREIMTPGAHLPHDPLFLDHEGEGCSQLWLDMCYNYLNNLNIHCQGRRIFCVLVCVLFS